MGSKQTVQDGASESDTDVDVDVGVGVGGSGERRCARRAGRRRGLLKGWLIVKLDIGYGKVDAVD